MHVGQRGNAVFPLAGPVGVVPEDEGALVLCRPEHADGIVHQQAVGILDEDRIIMPRGHLPRDLGSAYDQQIMILRLLFGEFIGTIAIRMRDILFVRLVLQVFCEGDGIEPVHQGLHHADIRPHTAVGEDGMLMEIALEGFIAGDVREFERPG